MVVVFCFLFKVDNKVRKNSFVILHRCQYLVTYSSVDGLLKWKPRPRKGEALTELWALEGVTLIVAPSYRQRQRPLLSHRSAETLLQARLGKQVADLAQLLLQCWGCAAELLDEEGGGAAHSLDLPPAVSPQW